MICPRFDDAASRSTMDKLYSMRPSVMAQAYRDQEGSPGVADMTYDEHLAMIVDAKLGEGAIANAVIDRIGYRSEVICVEGDETMR